jgi:hypothetical protein
MDPNLNQLVSPVSVNGRDYGASGANSYDQALGLVTLQQLWESPGHARRS